MQALVILSHLGQLAKVFGFRRVRFSVYRVPVHAVRGRVPGGVRDRGLISSIRQPVSGSASWCAAVRLARSAADLSFSSVSFFSPLGGRCVNSCRPFLLWPARRVRAWVFVGCF